MSLKSFESMNYTLWRKETLSSGVGRRAGDEGLMGSLREGKSPGLLERERKKRKGV